MLKKGVTIELNKFKSAVILAIVLLFLFICRDSASLKFFCKFSLVNTAIVIMIVCSVSKRIFSISSMFMLFLAVFHFGQAWLYVFDQKVDTTISYDIFSLYSDNVIHNTLVFSLFCYNFIALFWVLFLKNKPETIAGEIEQSSSIFERDKELVLKFGVVFFLVLLIPILIYDISCIRITAESGYSGLYDNAESLSVLSAVDSYFPLAVIMVLIGCNPEKNAWKWIYYYSTARCILLMILTGKRATFVIPLLLYIFCKHRFIKRYERKYVVAIVVALLLFLSLISFISYERGDYSNMGFFDFVREKNIITQLLSEMGGTFTTTVLSRNYAVSRGFLKGRSYLGALSVFFPFSNTLFAEIKSYMSVSELLNPYSPSRGALGGSLFGEMYINFGYYSLLLAPLFAWSMSNIESIIEGWKRRNLFAVCGSIYISYGFWIYVRGNFVDVVFLAKRTLYVLIFFVVFKELFSKKRSKHEKKSFDSL